MAHENSDQKMEFLLEQQAQSAARIQQIEEIILSLTRGTRDRFEGTDKRLDDVDVKIVALIDSQIRTEDSIKKTQDSIKETQENIRKTEENVKKTDEALRNLIAVVDRYIERRNGNSQA